MLAAYKIFANLGAGGSGEVYGASSLGIRLAAGDSFCRHGFLQSELQVPNPPARIGQESSNNVDYGDPLFQDNALNRLGCGG
jgi:hypothetical protein